jgi:predicted DNA-binding transcriptional regulator YafY
LRGILPASLMKSMDGFFTQARTNLDPYANANARREREWLSKVRVISTTQPLLPPKIKPEVFEQVSSALFGNFWLEMEYKNAGGKTSHVEVMPLGLAQQGPRIYLVCRYKDFDNERSLALHRIISAQASTLQFERPKDFDLKKYDDDGRFGFGEGKRIKLSFHINKGAGYHLLESPLSADQHVNELDDGYEITATVVDTAQLNWWLNGFGDAVTKLKKEYLA